MEIIQQKILTGNSMKTNKLYLILTLLVLVFGANNVYGQRYYIKSGYNRSNYYSRGNSKLFNVNAQRIYFGVKGGMNFAYFEYGNHEINSTVKTVVHPLAIAGLFVEFNLGNVVSLSPGVSYKADGTRLTGTTFDGQYKMTAHNLVVNLPIYINMPMSRFANPYIFAAPEMQFNCFSGNVSLEGDQDIIHNGNRSYTNYGIKFGAGCIIWYEIGQSVCFIRVDCGYNFGFTNTYSQKEIDGISIPINNVNSYKITGARYNRGTEICVSAGFPFIFK